MICNLYHLILCFNVLSLQDVVVNAWISLSSLTHDILNLPTRITTSVKMPTLIFAACLHSVELQAPREVDMALGISNR